MSFKIGGIDWVPESAAAHAQRMLDDLNAGRQSRGETPLVATTDNAIWLMLLAAGSMQQEYDQKLNAGVESLNLDVCSDQQLLNLAAIAGTSQNPATYSTLKINVTAAVTGPCTIVEGAEFPFENYRFKAIQTTVIPLNTTVSIVTVADEPGPIVVVPGKITSMVSPPPNFASCVNVEASVPGAPEESLSAFRRRLQTGQTINWDINGTARALRSLVGVQHAAVYFNPSNSVDLVLPGPLTIPPRYAQLVIQGYSDEIAATFFSRMTAPTQGAVTQDLTLGSGQTIQIKWTNTTQQNVFVKVTVDGNAPYSPGFEDEVANLILQLNELVGIGTPITSQLISERLYQFQYATIAGCYVSLDDTTWVDQVALNAVSVPVFLYENVTVVIE